MENLGKRGKKATSKGFEALRDIQFPSEKEAAPHSLSSAATGEGPETPNESAGTSEDKINDALKAVYAAHREGREISAVYEHQLQGLEPEEIDRFNQRLKDEGPDHGVTVFDPDHVATDPSGAEGSITLERPEWSELMRKPATGEILGKRYWRTEDGSVYIDSRTRNYHGNVPHRIAHGGKHVIFDKGGDPKTVYWDSVANDFTENDPTPEVRDGAEHAKTEHAQTTAEVAFFKERRHERARERAARAQSVEVVPVSVPEKTPENIPEPQAGPRIQSAEELERLLKSLASRSKKQPNSSPEPARAAPRDRLNQEYIANQARSSDFHLLEHNTAATTGPGEPSPNLYASRAMPGSTFTQEHVDAVARRERNLAPAPEQEPVPEPGRDEALDRTRDEYAQDREGARARTPDLQRQAPRLQRNENQDYLNSGLLSAQGIVARPWRLEPSKYIGVQVKRIPEILSSPRDQQFFGEMLRAIDPNKGEVLARFHEGTLTQEDMDFLTYGAHEYSKWMKEGEAVAAAITAEDVELMARRNPDMANFIAFLPRGREKDMLKELVLHTAMRNPAQLEDMRDAFKELKRARETRRFKRYEEKIEAQAERLGIEVKDYGAMFDLKNETRRKRTEARLAKHIHEEAGSFRRAIDWVEKVTRSPLSIPGSSYYKAILETREAGRLTPHQKSIVSPRSWVLDTVNRNLGSLTEYLSATASDPEVRRAVVREALTNHAQERGDLTGPKTYSEVQAHAAENTEKKIKERLEAHITARHPDFRSMPASEQDSILSDYKRDEERRRGRGTGFFSWLSSVLFGNNFDKAARDVTGREVRYA